MRVPFHFSDKNKDVARVGHPDQREGSGAVVMPLKRMTTDERLAADYAGTGLTTGPHPLAYHRETFLRAGLVSADDLTRLPNHHYVRVAGCVIARQRPGTAKGFVFLSLEDETGIANVIFTPDAFEENRVVVTRSRFVCVEGPLQQQDGVIHIRAQRIAPLDIADLQIESHNFH
jgi:error-prone DNA polymerase